jgi:hypothetical protein
MTLAAGARSMYKPHYPAEWTGGGLPEKAPEVPKDRPRPPGAGPSLPRIRASIGWTPAGMHDDDVLASLLTGKGRGGDDKGPGTA